MDVIFKDEHIIVCIKPAGLLSAEDASGKSSVPRLLREEQGIDMVYPVHRLDREVSGLMVYALTQKAAAILSAAAADHTCFKKEYLAVVSGCPTEEEGTFEDLLFKDSAKNKSFVVKKERKGVKKAKLSYKIVESFDDKTLVRVRLYTGRTHQIRVQFASRKMPLLGDRKYGGPPNDKGIALYSCCLEFAHPDSHEVLRFEHPKAFFDMV